jgi:uncharacterized protein (TIGR03663 family)
MHRAAYWVAFAAALALSLALRLTDPAARPMHHDEANQAVRFGILLETGDYRYDRTDHHGPTLYYLTLPVAWARGQHTLAALDERTIRMVPAAFGAGMLLLFPLLAGREVPPDGSSGIGRTAVVAAAALAAISPVLTYYSRFYVQESLFVFFVVGFLIAIGRYAQRPSIGPAIWAGALAGLAYATKETSIVVLPVAVVACAVGAMVARPDGEQARAGPPARHALTHALAALGAALLPALLLYTAFFSHPAGLFDSFSAFSIYLSRGIEPGPHVHPWYFYLQTLAWSSAEGTIWSEALVLVLAAVGLVAAIATRRRAFWPFYICLYAIGTAAIFSAIRYKTPWNLMPFYAGFILLAGIGVSAILVRARHPIARAAAVVVLVAAGWQLAAQSVRASFRYAADPRNPYVYAHTTPDFMRLVSRVHDLAALHPDGRDLLVKVVAGPYEQWPFPWYARDLTRVGYWIDAAAAGSLADVPVIVASQEQAAAIEAAVGERHVSEFYGLRQGVLLTLFVERGLWDRFLESRQERSASAERLQ